MPKSEEELKRESERMANDPKALDQVNERVIKEFRENKGKVGGMFEGMPVLLMTLTGAKSGRTLIRPVCYTRDVPPRRRARPRRRATAKTRPAVRNAAARAVDRVLSSRESFALLIRRLESAGWQIERPAFASDDDVEATLTSPARAR